MKPAQIICAKCGTPVEKTEWWDDHASGDRVLRVYCHGEVDEMRLTQDYMTHARQGELDALAMSRGVAFATPRCIGFATPKQGAPS